MLAGYAEGGASLTAFVEWVDTFDSYPSQPQVTAQGIELKPPPQKEARAVRCVFKGGNYSGGVVV